MKLIKFLDAYNRAVNAFTYQRRKMMIKITNLGGPKAVEIGTLVAGETFLNVDGQVCIVLRNMETYTDIFCIETLEAKNMWRESLVVPIQCELKWWPK